jgi:thiol-disulfide isomerase/thioredoxin
MVKKKTAKKKTTRGKTTRRSMEPEIIWGQNIEKAIQGNETVVIAFCAQWCGPCNAMRFNVLPRVMKTYGGPDPIACFVVFSDLLCENSSVRAIAERFAVDEDHPAVIIFRNGQETARNGKCWGNAEEQYEAVCKLIVDVLSNLPENEEIAA